MIYEVHFGGGHFEPVEAADPGEAACRAVERLESWRNDYLVGSGIEERAVHVSTPHGRVLVIVSGRLTPIYSAETK